MIQIQKSKCTINAICRLNFLSFYNKILPLGNVKLFMEGKETIW